MSAPFAAPDVTVEALGDPRVIRARQPLATPARCTGDWLVHWARETPDATALAERGADGAWVRLSYAALLAQVRATGQALLDRGVTPERPLMLLSDNGLDTAVLLLAAQVAGVPAAPVSPAYSLASRDFAKLRYIRDLVTPALIYARNGAAYGPALAALDLPAETVVVRDAGPDGATALADLRAEPGSVDAAFDAVGPNTVAKILFTSGSTGPPKGVINTQRMLTSNQQATAQIWPFLDRPVLVDWLPWHHTFGGNLVFNMALCHGGTLTIDAGRPLPGRLQPTLDALMEISPTVYFNVPRGYDMLLPHLEADDGLAARFFARLVALKYAGAALPAALHARLAALARRITGRAVPILSGWGATETAPTATCVHWSDADAGSVGVPIPGTEVMLKPRGDRLELRVRGPNVTPGYWRRPDLTARAFDADGFLIMGDAGRLADDNEPARGLVLDGRLAENFKLTSGTWVHVGALRAALVDALAPLVQDAVLTGEGRAEVGVLLFPADPALVHDPALRAAVHAGLTAHNASNPATSRRVARALLLAAPPSIDAGEITDKGYVNQRAVLDRRAADVARLYGDETDVLDLAAPAAAS